MTERWICARCFTSAEASATMCPNCGLERGAEAASAAGEVDAPQARPDDAQARPDDAQVEPPPAPADQARTAPDEVSQPPAVAMAAASLADGEDRWVCRQCFFSNEATATACANCGLPRGSEAANDAAGSWTAPGQPPATRGRAVPWRLLIYGVIAVVVVAGGAIFAARRGDTGEITDAGDMSVFDLAVGDCFDVPDADADLQTVRGIPCDEAHTYEVFWTGDYPGDVQPAEDEYVDWLQDGCLPAFEAYVGLAYADSIYYIGSLSPTEDSWANGDRAFACYVSNEAETPISGSAEGTAQ